MTTLTHPLPLLFPLFDSDNHAFFRLLAPALIASGSSIFLTLSPTDMDGAVRAALTLMLQDVCLYTRKRITDVGIEGGREEGDAEKLTHSPTPPSLPPPLPPFIG